MFGVRLFHKFPFCSAHLSVVVSEKAAPVDQDTHSPGSTSTQPLPSPNISYGKVLPESPAVSLSNSPCQSPMLREEDEHSETGESEGEDEDDVPEPQWTESDREVTEVDINDVDMNKVGCTFLCDAQCARGFL